MKLIKKSVIAVSLSLALSFSAEASAFADGMPFKQKGPEPVLTPLDKALDDIQNKQPPIDVKKEEPTPPPAPAKEALKKEEPLPAPAAAVSPAPPVPEARVVEVQPNTSFFGLSVGMYDPFSHGKQAASLNLEFQPGVQIAGILQPLFGALVTTNGALMGYGGVGIPFHIGTHYRLMPSVAVGAYHRGGGVDLHHALGFRVGTELAYVYDDNSRIGLNMHVLSSGASLGREDRTEVIGLAYTVPLELMGATNVDTMKNSDAKKPDAWKPTPPLEK